MLQAWNTAVLYRAETIPPLSELLGDPAEPQTDEDLTFNLAAFAAATSQAEPTA